MVRSTPLSRAIDCAQPSSVLASVIGRRGACQVPDLVDFDVERKADVVTEELELRVEVQVVSICLRPGEEIIDADDFMTVFKQPIDQV